jgi:hypothetical protein
LPATREAALQKSSNAWSAATASCSSATTPGTDPRLILVTCGGPFDQARHRYRDNLIVYAVPA